MSECTHDCSSCGESCADRQGGSPFLPQREGNRRSFRKILNAYTQRQSKSRRIKSRIAVLSRQSKG